MNSEPTTIKSGKTATRRKLRPGKAHPWRTVKHPIGFRRWRSARPLEYAAVMARFEMETGLESAT